MKTILLFLLGICISFHSIGQGTGCSTPVIPDTTVNGVALTHSQSGAVTSSLVIASSCTPTISVPSGMLRLGFGSPTTFSYQITFSQPVNNIVIILYISSANGALTVTSSSGTPTLSSSNWCNVTFPSNVITGTAVAGAGVFTVTAASPYTSLTFTGPGGSNGMALAFCADSINPPCSSLTLNSEPNLATFTYSNYHDITAGSAYNVVLAAQNINMQASDFVLLTRECHIGSGTVGSQLWAHIVACDSVLERHMAPEPFQENIPERQAGLILYPNPAASRITVMANGALMKTLLISKTDGRNVFKQTINATEFDVDISAFAQGIYLITAETDDGETLTQKLIKN